MMILGDWLQLWLRMYVDVDKLAPSTKSMYHSAVGAVPERLKLMELQELTPLHLHAWLLDVSSTKPRAAQIYHVMLHRSLSLAAKLRYCSPLLIDPELVPPPRHEPRKADVLTGEQLRAYIGAAKDTRAAPALLMCCCGLRRGEALGMRWDCVDMEAGTMAIVGQRRNGAYMPCKTRASMRCLLMPVFLCNVLRDWPKTCEYCLDGGEHLLYTEHQRVLQLLGLSCSLHGLRHSVATLAALQGVPMKALQGALGHANFAITADLYANHLPDVSAVMSQVW